MRGCGRIERPAFPAPSDFQMAGTLSYQLAHLREIAEVCLTFVVPAKAGTHNHKRFFEQKLSATVPNREATEYGSLRSQGRQRRFAARVRRCVCARANFTWPRARGAHAG